MGKSPCCEKAGLKKGAWTPEEDQMLMAFIEEHGHGSWRSLPAKAGLKRCGKSCRLRWTNYLRPDIKRGKFSLQEEQTIIQLHALLGNRWSAIATHLPKRTDNEIKNYWNTNLKKRLTRMGIDPITHKPKVDYLSGQCNKDSSNLSHMAQWESARLEAEARLVRESKLKVQNQLGPTSSRARLVLNKIPARPSLPPCLDVLKAWQSSWSNNKSLPQTKDTNRMHSMYAMMLATDDLESPTSTLSFPESMHPTPTTSVGLINENVLPPTTINVASATAIDSIDRFTKSSTCEGGVMKEASDSESCRYLTKQNPEAELSETQKRMDHTNMSCLHLHDDDIMVAVEAFRGVRYENSVTPLSSISNVLEGLNNDMLVFDSNDNLAEENLAISNGDGSICNVNYFEENNNYWSSILNTVNDSFSGSPVF